MIGIGRMIEQNISKTPKTLMAIALSSIILGSLFGALTNIINGAVSPFYFELVMGWRFNNIWKASIAQGIFEGTIYGIFFSIVFTTGFGLITKGKASLSFALKILIQVLFFIMSCWFIGGAIATLLALLSPDFYHSHFYFPPKESSDLLRFAWVGGSIWGGIIGAVLGCILSLVWTKNTWNKNSDI